MKKLFFVLMAVVAIALTGCYNPKNDPEAPENGRDHTVLLTDTNGANQANRVPIRMPLSTCE